MSALGMRNRRHEFLPFIGKERTRTFRVLIEPLDLRPSQQKDTAQDQLRHALRKRLRVSERQRGTPRPAEHQPSLDPEMRAQCLDIRDQMLRGVLDETRARQTPSATSLVEEHESLLTRIEEAAHLRIGPRART